MSQQESEPTPTNPAESSDAPADRRTREELQAQLDLLEEENRRLRAEYVRARQAQYRQAAVGLGVVGLVALGGAALFPVARDVLLVLGAIGVFGAVLTYYLTPERFISAEVGERIYAMLASNEADLTAELGLTDTRVYVPLADAGTELPARLFVPQRASYDLPDADDLQSVLVVGDDERTRGVALAPSGGGLFREFEEALAGPLGETPGDAATQITDALVEDFELVDAAESDVDAGDGRVSVRVTGSAYGDPGRFDHPVQSFVAVALAIALDEPVSTETTAGSEDGDFTVTCRWEVETEREEATEQDRDAAGVEAPEQDREAEGENDEEEPEVNDEEELGANGEEAPESETDG